MTNSSVANGPVSFQVNTPDSSNYSFFSNSKSVSASDGFYWTLDYSKGSSISSGDFDFRVNETNGTFQSVTGVLLDSDNPSVSSESPSGHITDDSPNPSYDSSDSHAGVDSNYIKVEDSNGNLEEEANSTSVNLDNLDDDSYTVTYQVRDKVGNWNNGSWSFTVDTTADFTLNPSYDPEPGNILMESDKDIDVTIDENNEDKEVELTCMDDNGNDFDSYSDDDTSFTCEIDEDDVSGETDMKVEVCDKADNCKTSDTSEFVFDKNPPSWVDKPNMDVKSVNSNFTVDFSATDNSGLQVLEYYFKSGADDDNRTQVSVNESDDSFEVNPTGLDRGTHKLHVRLKDQVGRWSSVERMDFEYYPDEDPEISVLTPGRILVTAGETNTTSVNVNNSGKLLVSDVELTVSGFASFNQTISELEPGESVSLDYNVSATESDIGLKSVDISTDDPSTSRSLDVRVKANSNQRKTIEDRLSGYRQKLEKLDYNVTDLKESGLPDSVKSSLESNVSDFKEKVEKAQKKIDSGKYYEADSIIEDIGSSYARATNSYENAREKLQKKKNRRKWMMALAGIVILGLGAGGLFMFTDRFRLDLDQVIDSDISVRGLDDLQSRLRTIFESKEEAEEFEWNGFK